MSTILRLMRAASRVVSRLNDSVALTLALAVGFIAASAWAGAGEEGPAASEKGAATSSSFEEHVITTEALGASDVVAADLDGDGDQDVISASSGDNTIAWYESSGGAAPEFTRRVITTEAIGAVAVVAADLNRDGAIDVVSASAGDGTIAWYENDGARPPVFIRHVITTAAPDPRAIHVADLNGDGLLDILSASAGDNKVAWHQNQGQPTPAFTPRTITTVLLTPEDVTTADLDNDGDLDVITASSGDDRVTWFENDGEAIPQFIPDVVSTSIRGAISIAVADISGDGRIDIAVVSKEDHTASWFINEGLGGPDFITRVLGVDFGDDGSILTVDIDSDGKVDLVSASVRETGILFHRNATSRPTEFDSQVLVAADGPVTTVSSGDIDGDGDADLIVGLLDPQSISWYKNDLRPMPTYTQHNFGRVIDFPRILRPIDLDGDTDIDFVAKEGGQSLGWLKNDGAKEPTFEFLRFGNQIFAQILAIFITDLNSPRSKTSILDPERG